VAVTVNGVNDAPVAVNDAGTTNENTNLTVAAPGVLGNDSDPDVEALSVAEINGSAADVGDEITLTSGAKVTLNADGSYTYKPNGQFEGLDTGETASDSFKYRASDGGANSNEATVTITITGVNDAPVCLDRSITTDENTIGSVAASCSDPDGESLTISVTQPTKGVSSYLDPNLRFNPNGQYEGLDTGESDTDNGDFTYKANDGTADSNTANVAVTVNGVNDPPVAVNDTGSTNEDTPIDIEVILNDTDVDDSNGELRVHSIISETNGTAQVQADGRTVRFTPAANANSSNTPGGFGFTYKAKDADGAVSNTATATITVNAVNDPPAANDDTTSTPEDTAKVIDVKENDNPGPGEGGQQSLTLTITDPPDHGTAVVITSGDDAGKIRYTPEANYNGPDSFEYEACDNGTPPLCDRATVNITVTPVNDAPVLLLSAPLTTAQYSDSIPAVTATATDVDDPGTELTFSVDSPGLPLDLSLSPAAGNSTAPGLRTTTISGRLNVSIGDYLRTIRVKDDSNSSDTEQLTIKVTAENATVTDIGPPTATVDGTDGDKDGLVVTMLVHEAQDGELSGTLSTVAGLANAKPIAVTLTPVGTGSSYSCTAINTAYLTGDPDSASASCPPLNDVKVNVYEVSAVIGGNYFTGDGLGVITIMDPALGFTTGGGFFTMMDGTTPVKVNFGFNAKVLKSGQVQGSSLAIFNRPTGNYVVKSNAMGGLAISKFDPSNPSSFYTTTFTGKATYGVPPKDPLLWCNERKCGSYSFTVYVEDRKEPGTGIDKYWIETKAPAGAAPVLFGYGTMAPGAVANAATITGGNIQVPQPQNTGK
jgi:VCBS repeat-containing protein